VAAQHPAGGTRDRLRGTAGADQKSDETPLLPETTAASMRESLATPAMMAAPGARLRKIVRSGRNLARRPGAVIRCARSLPIGLDRKSCRRWWKSWLAAQIAPIVGKKGSAETPAITRQDLVPRS